MDMAIKETRDGCSWGWHILQISLEIQALSALTDHFSQNMSESITNYTRRDPCHIKSNAG